MVPMDAIFISGISMSFFIALLLLTKRHKALTDKILAVWVTVIGVHLLSYFLYHLGYWQRYPHMIGITAPFPLLHGPLLYLYTLYSLRPDRKLRRVDYLHFAPALMGYLYMSRFFFFYSAEEKMLVDSGAVNDFSVFSSVLLVAFIASGLTYAVLSYRLTRKHQQKIEENFSYEEGINLIWLRNCIYGIGIIFLAAAIIIVLRDAMGVSFSFNADFIFYSLIILFIFYLGYFGIRHRDMFADNPAVEPGNLDVADTEEKYKKSGLKPEALDEAHRRLRECMSLEKPYLDPKLNLAALADSVGVSPNQLSQVINQKEQVNFHDFVNRYRVEEFIRLASENRNYSLLAIALDSGFNSKSSFNGIFKKQTGTTPSQYISQMRNEKGAEKSLSANSR